MLFFNGKSGRCNTQALNVMYNYSEVYVVECDLRLTLHNGYITEVDTLPRDGFHI